MRSMLPIVALVQMALCIWLMLREARGKKPNRPWPQWAKAAFFALMFFEAIYFGRDLLALKK